MLKVENIDVWGFEHAIRGMRNPLNSWDKSDSRYIAVGEHYEDIKYVIGESDLGLMKRLYKAGPEHRKYLRQIFVSVDITAPLYWWKEFDTYKVGTVANSCSTMHKIAAKEFELDDFSHEHLIETVSNTTNTVMVLKKIIECLNYYRSQFIFTKDKKYWWQMIQLLPSSYNQKRTITMNYENVLSMIKQRTGHKLTEWEDFCIILKHLPYIEDIME